MNTNTMPLSADDMYQAFLDRKEDCEGLFIVAVRTTGIFCRPTCPARRPKRENVEFYPTSRAALNAGFRPCRRCRPLAVAGATPDWLVPLLERVEQDPTKRWTDADLRAADVEPTRVRRWFNQHHGMTFHAYLRARRLGAAIGHLHQGVDVTTTAFASGYHSLSGFRDGLRKWLGETPSVLRHEPPLLVNRLLTPLGPMIAAADDEGLALLEFVDRRMLATQFRRVARLFRQPLAPGDHPLIDRTKQQLDEYFTGQRTEFDLPLRSDGTEFQSSVWQMLFTIGYGETRSYDQIARQLGRAGAQRAVGRANGDNRFAIVIPCHRVIRSDGALCGYGGGLWRKQWLLAHEKSVATALATSPIQ